MSSYSFSVILSERSESKDPHRRTVSTIEGDSSGATHPQNDISPVILRNAVTKDPHRRTVSTIEGDSSGATYPHNDTLGYDNIDTDTVLLQQERQGVVHLSHEQAYELLTTIGPNRTKYYVQKLAAFIKEHNANIKDHYAMLMKWWQEDGGTYNG